MLRKYLRKSLSHILRSISSLYSSPQSSKNPLHIAKQYSSSINPSIFDMKIFTIFTASALLGAFAHAAPPSALDTRQFLVSVTFSGADKGTQFSQTFPADNSVVKISTFSKVSSSITYQSEILEQVTFMLT